MILSSKCGVSTVAASVVAVLFSEQKPFFNQSEYCSYNIRSRNLSEVIVLLVWLNLHIYIEDPVTPLNVI
jgi:hypothetical protein